MAAHLRSAPLPGHVRLRVTRSRTGALEKAVLGHARASAFIPGTNLRGDTGGAAWLFLLPSLELGRVLCIGAPSAAALRTLGRLADELVVCGGRRERWVARRRCARAGIRQVQVLSPGAVPARRADLAVVSGKDAAVHGVGAVFMDKPGDGPPSSGCELCLAPAAGEPSVVAANGDAATLSYLAAATGPRARDNRRALIAAHGFSPDRLGVPAYVRDIAATHGLDLEEHRVGLAAPTEYASRKAVMFLFRGQESEPELVVKLARDERQNERLENEWRALGWLSDLNVPGNVPRHAFLGHHAGLAVLGQSALQGFPFRGRTSARPDCPLARAALEWLLELGRATAHPAPDGDDVEAAMSDLASRFHALYRLTGRQRAALKHHIDALAGAGSALPLVLQHGDPGTWNLLVGPGGAPAFLDWEAAERHGMPLWDAFYFMRSFAVTVARAKGRTSRLGAVRREFLADNDLSRLLAAAVERHCAEIALDRELVKPLFVTCWMHRALKEATRLAPARLDSGHYVNLLRLSLN
jgi:Phosphotransferase enzyme family